jgi:hypothetical protein
MEKLTVHEFFDCSKLAISKKIILELNGTAEIKESLLTNKRSFAPLILISFSFI